jgi:exopolysaccharide biosynthesis polyprenyl glycosylphosphotransferase
LTAGAKAGERSHGASRAPWRALERRGLIAADVLALSLVLVLPVAPLHCRVLFAGATALVLTVTDSYAIPLVFKEAVRARHAFTTTALAYFLTAAAAFLAGNSENLWFLALPAFVSLIALRCVAGSIIFAGRRKRGGLHTVVIGAGAIGQEIVDELQRYGKASLRPIGFIDSAAIARRDSHLPMLGHVDDFDQIVETHGVDAVVVAWGELRERQLLRTLRSATSYQLEVLYVPRFFTLQGGTLSPPSVGGIPLERLAPAAEDTPGWRVKRGIDIAFSLTLLLALAPLLAALAIATKLSSSGPVLFRQTRVGQHGHPFELLKFRTMAVDHDGDRAWQAGACDGGDQRTTVGKLLRKTSLDELPQLLNVLRGDMSLVGPRPERPVFVDQFEREVLDYRDRHRVPVGITGWAQVNDLRGNTSIARRARFDNAYIDEWRLGLDLRILMSTIGRVARDVVSAEDRDTRGVASHTSLNGGPETPRSSRGDTLIGER